ncbi:MAG: hypothetical protein AAGA85_16505 [Bacteroidota bacterium]
MTNRANNIWMTIGSLCLQMVPVVLGVFLAMWLNDYKVRESDRRFIASMLESINAENGLNAQQIEGLLDKQKRTCDSLEFYQNDSKVALVHVISKVNGLSTPDLNETSLNLLQASPITLISFDLLTKLSEIDANHENYNYNQRVLSNYYYVNTTNSEKEVKLTLSYMLADIIYYEEQILMRYQELDSLLSR